MGVSSYLNSPVLEGLHEVSLKLASRVNTDTTEALNKRLGDGLASNLGKHIAQRSHHADVLPDNNLKVI